MSTLVGMELGGRYRLDAQIGAGGMSTVYRAFDQVLERRVAIKLMHREFATDSDQLERFRREARAVAQLSHPHVVGVIDAGEDGDPDHPNPFIVFEYVEGETLKDRIRRLGRLPVDEAIAYAIEIARALGAAHAVGIVHRDIKPQNILIDEEGTAKVTDFGIARSLTEEGLTAEGRVLGTTDYVSPEQALGQHVDGRSDLYSLGVVLFEMLTGDVPFHGENQVSVAMKHVREAMPDVQALRPEVTAGLARVLDRATDKDLDRRYPDAPAMVRDLEDALAIQAARTGQATGEATAVLRTLPPDTRRRLPVRLRWRLPLLVIILLGAVAAAAFAFILKEGVDRTQRGSGAIRDPAPANTQPVSVRSDSASDYDPLGDREEHEEEAGLVLDRDASTTWSTETYQSFDKGGVGIYVDAVPRVEASVLEVHTSRRGWRAEIYAARSGPPETLPDRGWQRVGGGPVERRKQRFRLDTDGQAYRYYLVWITQLPPDEQRAEIGEIQLYRPDR